MWIPRPFNAALFLLAWLVLPASAASLTVLSPASAAPGLKAVAAQFTLRTGIAVTLGGGARDKILAALKDGSPADVVVLPSTDIAELSAVSGMAPLGRIGVGVAVQAETPAPDVSTRKNSAMRFWQPRASPMPIPRRAPQPAK